MTGALATKLVKVMEAVDYIPKRGRNVTQNYDYATDADIADTVRTEMAKQRVVMLPKVTSHSVRQIKAKDRDININTVEMEFTFIDADSGESFTVATVGEGMDSGDKGCYKAMTGATKYALLKSFQIPTGDDPEQDNGEVGGRQEPRGRAPGRTSTAKPADAQAADKPADREASQTTSSSVAKPDYTAFWKSARELNFTPVEVNSFAGEKAIVHRTQAELDKLLADLKAVRAKEAGNNA